MNKEEKLQKTFKFIATMMGYAIGLLACLVVVFFGLWVISIFIKGIFMF